MKNAPETTPFPFDFMTDDVIAAAQDLLNRGQSRRQIIEKLGIKYDTLRKAINQGRLRELSQPPSQPQVAQPATHSTAPQSQPTPSLPLPTDKSQRGVADVAAEMGVACTRPEERVLAAFGMLQGASTRFEECRNVSFHKLPKDNWAVEEFQETLVTLSCGEVGGASGAIEVRAAVPQSQTLDGYSEDDCIPGRDVDDAGCARIISERS